MGLLLTNSPVALTQITWGATGTFTNNTVLALAGAVSNEVYGVDFGFTSYALSGAVTTANGYKFSDYATSGNTSIAGSPPSFTGYMTGGYRA
jgi:hypothetical protein